ncbi:hypothetical protein MHYMCMPSP_00615 [Hyalomma marginatum]|uniref:Uncharacterized protein n=1 Tax=Hyalomma marginatum TaxID=34627 RepID=A0A8S4BW98_9ACAR|nr:hypothetical protein MHYMCMPASI_00381 [Hyalomma marginatum]CAG7592187.1 hypothetical protein MHYMCMPSP_00615 [Hyalomma marginatum]
MITIIREVIKYHRKDMCTNYDWCQEIDLLSKVNNTLPQFAKQMIEAEHMYVTLGSECKNNVIKLLLMPLNPF